AGRVSSWLGPPPPSAHDVSFWKLPLPRLRAMVVPPTATTFGDTAGYEVPGLSPLATKYVTPAAVKVTSPLDSPENSPVPQLFDICPPPPAVTSWPANATAASRSERLSDCASTSMILALGAMAWAHWMSREI